MLDVLVEVAEDVEAPAAARVSAAAKILDRALGKAPDHVDVTAVHHTEIVYRSGRGDQTGADQRGCARSFTLVEGCKRVSDAAASGSLR